MKPVIDIHCHILPGIDDGAKDGTVCRQMLEIARDEGVRMICATPHYKPERWPASCERIRQAAEEARRIAREVDPEMQIVLGNELYYRSHSRQALAEGSCLRLNDSRYVLVEFNPLKDFPYVDRALYELQAEGYIPLLAHVERYECLRNEPRRIEDLLDRRICMQMNAESLSGELGFAQTRYAKGLVRQGYIHVVASDAHDAQRRAPRFAKCRRWLAKTQGEEYADELMYGNPLRILQDEDL